MDDEEAIRQQTIERYQLGGNAVEPELDTIARLTSDLFDVPISAVTVLGPDRQILQGACGVAVHDTPRDQAFCNYTVQGSDVFIVEDASADPRFRDNPLVTGETQIRFYAGAPVRIGGGVPVGALCVIDRHPRQLSETDRRRLTLLAETVGGIMELRIGSRLNAQREQELQAKAELLRATLDHVQQGIGVFDAIGTLVLSNEQLFALLGVEPEAFAEGRGQVYKLLSAAAERGAIASEGDQQIGPLISADHSSRPAPHLLRGRDGRIFEAWHVAVPNGRSILTVDDVTERRQVAKIKDEFVSTVSHELRTPLTSIRGALAVLGRNAEKSLDAQGLKMLDMASRNAERLTNLVNDILDIEKLASGALTMRPERIDLAHVLRDACDQNRPYAASYQVEFALLVDEPLPIMGDFGRLQQAVTNLLSNACKFSPAGSSVTVTGKRENDRIKVMVEDRGPGIPADFRSRIFRRFAQADPEHRAGNIGTGLGLAITKAIVDQHHGRIGYESEPGEGTCFWLTLPRFDENGEGEKSA
jgi:signal transduction histidine kinase